MRAVWLNMPCSRTAAGHSCSDRRASWPPALSLFGSFVGITHVSITQHSTGPIAWRLIVAAFGPFAVVSA